MQTYSVAVDFSGPFDDDSAKINDRLGDFAEALTGHDAAITGCPEEPGGIGRYGARVTVEAATVEQAVAEATAWSESAAAAAGLPSFPIVRVEASEWVQFERDLEEPTYPRLLGISELGELIGITRQRASALARTSRFPAPAAELASGPVWFESHVRRFVKEWDRKPGRPRKDSTVIVHHDPAFQEMGGGMTAADIPLPSTGAGS